MNNLEKNFFLIIRPNYFSFNIVSKDYELLYEKEIFYDELNLSYDKSAAGLFIWGKINSTIKNDLEFTDELLLNHGVFITPGSIFGSNGKNYLRMSLCTKESTLKEILRRIKN